MKEEYIMETNIFRMVDTNAEDFGDDLTFILKTNCSREKLEEIEKNADMIWCDYEPEDLDEEYRQFVPNLYGVSKIEIMEIITKHLGYSWEVIHLEEVKW